MRNLDLNIHQINEETMTYRSVWWHPTHVEYAAGLANGGRTFSQVNEQYRRPHALYDLRYYDLPTEQYEEKLYYRMPRLALPEYRGTFRDKPHTVASFYPQGCPEGKPAGFHGRLYYEHGPPQFKYNGPQKDDLYWLERNPYLPSVPDRHPLSARPYGTAESHITLPSRCTVNSGCCRQSIGSLTDITPSSRRLNEPENRFVRTRCGPDTTKRLTHDGVGYL